MGTRRKLCDGGKHGGTGGYAVGGGGVAQAAADIPRLPPPPTLPPPPQVNKTHTDWVMIEYTVNAIQVRGHWVEV